VSDCPGGKRPSLRRWCSSFFRSLPSPKIIFLAPGQRNFIVPEIRACPDASPGQ
jgi:hypothetical protein